MVITAYLKVKYMAGHCTPKSEIWLQIAFVIAFLHLSTRMGYGCAYITHKFIVIPRQSCPGMNAFSKAF